MRQREHEMKGGKTLETKGEKGEKTVMAMGPNSVAFANEIAMHNGLMFCLQTASSVRDPNYVFLKEHVPSIYLQCTEQVLHRKNSITKRAFE